MFGGKNEIKLKIFLKVRSNLNIFYRLEKNE